MNGAQDLGGMQGFGPVRAETDEPWFHDDWERRVFALSLAMGATGSWNLDMSRAARESLPPAQYLASSYYRIWLEGVTKLMLERGLVTADELAAGRSLQPPAPLPRVLRADAVAASLSRGAPTERPAPGPARFAAGDAVRARLLNPATHTRLPRYVRGRPGTVVSVHGAHVYPDTHATGQGEQPQWLYTVRFDAADLWGEHTTAASVCVDCWEPYLESEAGGRR
jgi:nitrile hydratase subunit beta